MDDDKQILDKLDSQVDNVKSHLKESLATIRTGRANSSLLDGVLVEVYGTTMPLNQAASIATVDAHLLSVTPFDPNNLASIAKSISSHPSLGLNPVDDGRVIRLNIPSLTEERRKELARTVSSKNEEALVSLRSARHDAIDSTDKLQKDGLSEDDAKRLKAKIEDIINTAKAELEKLSREKEHEIMTV